MTQNPPDGDRLTRRPSTERIARAFKWLLLPICGATLLLAAQAPSLVVPGTYYTVPSVTVITLVLVLTIVSRWRFVSSAQLQAMFLIVGTTALMATLAGRLSSSAKTTELALGGPTRTFRSKDEWFEPYSGPDPVYGLKGRSNASAREHHRDFDVVYHTDAEGWRVTPTPKGPPPHQEIVFLGCSFTWGIGVDDQSTFPWILGSEAWPEYRIRNISCPAWGTVQVKLALDRLLESGVKPKAIFYGYMIHAQRNYLRRSWRTLVNNQFPYFTLDNGKLTYHGLRDAGIAQWDDSPELDRAEHDLTIALIDSMRSACAARGIPFIVVNLRRGDSIPEALAADHQHPFLNMEQVWMGYFPNDGHPGPDWHRMVAYTLASSFEVAKLTNNPDLYRPGSVSLSNVDLSRFHLELTRVDRQAGKNKATLYWRDGAARVDGIESVTKDPWQVRLERPRHTIIDGMRYTLRFQSRADSPRPVDVCVISASKTDQPVPLYEKIDVGTDWKEFQLPFVSKIHSDDALIDFRLSGSSVPIELRQIHLQDESGNEVLPKPLLFGTETDGRQVP